MNLKLKSRWLTTIAATALTLSVALPASARPAMLSGSDPGSRINVRSSPSVQANSPHYGLVGDRVEVLNETQGSDGYIWCYVRFSGSGAEGWIRGDYVRYL